MVIRNISTRKNVKKKAIRIHKMLMKQFRPTSSLRDPSQLKEYLSRDQFRLYKLIWERFVASQMASALWIR